jgi:hypothetical protein
MIIYGALDHLCKPSPTPSRPRPDGHRCKKPDEKCPEGDAHLMAIYGEMAIYAALSRLPIAHPPRLDDLTHLAAE